MKNEKLRLSAAAPASLPAAQAAGEKQARRDKGVKRFRGQCFSLPPAGATFDHGEWMRGWESAWVGVSIVAAQWGISPRRVRKLLADGRLWGRQLENGYWEVMYPYTYVFGKRGPPSKRAQQQPAPVKKREPKSGWW